MKKHVRSRMHVKVYPIPSLYTQADYIEGEERAICDAIIRGIKRHIDRVERIKIGYDSEIAVCSFCGAEWHECQSGSPSCCLKAINEWEQQQADAEPVEEVIQNLAAEVPEEAWEKMAEERNGGLPDGISEDIDLLRRTLVFLSRAKNAFRFHNGYAISERAVDEEIYYLTMVIGSFEARANRICESNEDRELLREVFDMLKVYNVEKAMQKIQAHLRKVDPLYREHDKIPSIEFL